jgi:branched-chain amino acid transport system ATP-binding protein
LASSLDVRDLTVDYGRLRALDGLTFSLDPGECVGIVGANGAGKSSALRAIGGSVTASSGSITLAGKTVSSGSSWRVARRGLRFVPETRGLFRDLTVHENLLAGASALPRRERSQEMSRVVDIFPRLEALMSQRAGVLSGGEQQMLALGRALIARPKILLMDEPGLGLAPAAIRPLVTALLRLKKEGMAMVVAEQSLAIPRAVCDRTSVLELGRVVASGPAATTLTDEIMRRAFLGKER